MRRRTEKYRGRRTHGRGKKAGRGAGLRGGKGNAGLHKHKYMHMLKFDPYHFGRHGFKRHAPKKDVVPINVGSLQTELPKLIEYGLAKKAEKGMVIDLTDSKYNKLLGGGSIKTPLTIRVAEATAIARQKVEAAGGKVETPEQKNE
jgi:large subunit ribosomal protein L15